MILRCERNDAEPVMRRICGSSITLRIAHADGIAASRFDLDLRDERANSDCDQTHILSPNRSGEVRGHIVTYEIGANCDTSPSQAKIQCLPYQPFYVVANGLIFPPSF